MTSISRLFIFFRQALIISTLFLGACRPDRDPAQWDVDALTPILNSRLDINDMVEDSLLQSYSDGLIHIVYRHKLADFKFERINESFNKDFFNTVKLQNINLGTRVVQNSISMGKLALRSGAAGAIVVINNGSDAAVPPLDGFGPYGFTLDASQYFESMTLQDGWLVVKIFNEFPVEITNFQYSIKNLSGGPDIMNRTVASIAPNSLYADSVQLTNNIVVEGKIRATIQNIDSPGSMGVDVPIDTSDVLDITVTIKKLDPVQATAIFPNQALLEQTENTEIENFPGQLTHMVVESGKMFIDATSTIEDKIVLEYNIPPAVNNGIALGFNEIVPAAAAGSFATHRAEKDISGYTVDLTGEPGSGLYNTFYTETNARIDSSGNLITLSLQDSVFLKTGISGLLASRSYGYLGKDTLQVQESSAVQLFDILTEAEQLKLEDVSLNLEVESYIGAPLDTVFNELSTRKNSSPGQNITWTLLGQDLEIPAATENRPGDRPTPGLLQIPINTSNSNIAELLESQPDIMELDLNAYLNGNLPVYVFDQFIYRDYGISAYLSTEIPMNMAFQNLLFRDTSTFSYAGLDPNDQLQSGELVLIGNNAFPFSVGVDMILLDQDGSRIGELTSSELLDPAQLDANQRVGQPVKSQTHYPLTAEKIGLLKDCHFIVFEARFSTPDFPGPVKFYNDNYLDLTLAGDLKLRTGK